eukprot:COSAG04_NODE_2820_length_3535_cov_4.592549_6_plen_154_part_01
MRGGGASGVSHPKEIDVEGGAPVLEGGAVGGEGLVARKARIVEKEPDLVQLRVHPAVQVADGGLVGHIGDVAHDGRARDGGGDLLDGGVDAGRRDVGDHHRHPCAPGGVSVVSLSARVGGMHWHWGGGGGGKRPEAPRGGGGRGAPPPRAPRYP